MASPKSRESWEPRAHRGIVVASRGIVAASQPLAVATGLRTLQAGGSCADAAIAVSATLVVTEPYNSHLGGDAFVIYYDAASGTTAALNGSGAAPRRADPTVFEDGIPVRGLRAATVPGLVDCWYSLHQIGGRIPIRSLLEPAIAYAREGFPAGFRYASVFGAHASSGESWFPSVHRALVGTEQLPEPGSTIVQPDLAWTLAQIADGGRDAFYAGSVAERIVRHSREVGGLLQMDDLAAHRTEVLAPLRTTYRGLTVHAQPPVSQGVILVEELNIVEGFDLAGYGFGSPAAVHALVEAKKLAFDDRARLMGDPRFVSAPTDRLVSKPYAAMRRAKISPQRAAGSSQLPSEGQDTTYFCVADAEGNAVSFIQSVYHAFGCGEIAAGTGVLFNNRMTGFSLEPHSPNRLEPGKRPMHTLNAYIVTDGSQLRYVGGTPGGDVQVQSNLQVITSLVDFGMNVQQAVEAPRWQHVPRGKASATRLELEGRFPSSVADDLRALGHDAVLIGPWQHGSAYQLIARDPRTGAFFGASDPRCDGHCAGW